MRTWSKEYDTNICFFDHFMPGLAPTDYIHYTTDRVTLLIEQMETIFFGLEKFKVVVEWKHVTAAGFSAGSPIIAMLMHSLNTKKPEHYKLGKFIGIDPSIINFMGRGIMYTEIAHHSQILHTSYQLADQNTLGHTYGYLFQSPRNMPTGLQG